MRFLMRSTARRLNDESGQVTIFVVAGLIMLIAFIALSLDAGVWLLDRRIAQNQADAAALAAALELPKSAADVNIATAKALEWLQRNGYTGGSICTPDNTPSEYTLFDPPGGPGVAYKPLGTPAPSQDQQYGTIRVCIDRSSPVLLSFFLGLTDVQIGARAAAGYEFEGRYAIYAMRPGPLYGGPPCTPSGSSRTLDFNGGPLVTLDDQGHSYTESECDDALHANCSTDDGCFRTNGEHDVRGDALCQSDPDCEGSFTTLGSPPQPSDINPNFRNLDDPFGCMFYPSAYYPPVNLYSDPCVTEPSDPGSGCAPVLITSNPFPLGPGVYCGLQIQNNEVVNLTGGIYIFKGVVSLSGSDPHLTSTGNEVLIYLTCTTSPCNGNNPGGFTVQGSASPLPTLDITGLGVYNGNDYKRIAIFVDRTAGQQTGSCGGSAKVRITGGGDVNIDGNIYNISTDISMEGGGNAVFDINGTIVGDRVCFGGTATYNVLWDQSAQNLVFLLVE